MGEQTDKEKLEAATKAAEAAKAEKAESTKLPAHLEADYTGPLTCEQASARIEHLKLHGRKHIGDLKAYETKPAAADATKGTK
jgi:hypothetical protein